MNQLANCTLGSVPNAIGLRLAFEEVAVKRGFENRRVVTSKLLVDNELLQDRNCKIFTNVDSNKFLRLSVRRLEDQSVARHERRLTRNRELS